MRLGDSAEVKCLAHDGTVLGDFEFPETPVTNQGEITESLTAMPDDAQGDLSEGRARR